MIDCNPERTVEMKLRWMRGQLMPVTRNTCLRRLVGKANRTDRRWPWIQEMLGRICLWRSR